jgi:NAD-dependent DNA ligase
MIDYKKLNKKELVDLLIKSDNQYYNIGEPIFTDNEYDEVKEYLRSIDKKNDYFKRIGADIAEDNKVKLPFFLGSQDKIKDDDKTLQKWIKKYNKPESYVIGEKLDGISCLIVFKNKKIHIYTRGNGIYGQNISHLKNKINGIPLNITDNISVRGEIIINKKNWLKIANKGSNARNVVAGFVNSKTVDNEVAKYVEFVAYDVLEPRDNLENSLILASTYGFNIVKSQKVEFLSVPSLYEMYKDWKENSKYEIDGLVVTHNFMYKIKSGENPKYSFAFKSLLMQEDAIVIVTDIEWNISKDKYLKPIVKFNEIKLNGVKIKQATGFNADYILKNKIGIGSKLAIIRSGDVIPHIKTVLTHSAKPLMPDVPYIWKGKDIILDSDTKNREQDIKIYSLFMKSLNIKGVGEGIITKLYDNSFNTLVKIINISKKDLLKIDGFKDKSATNIINSLSTIKSKSCLELMTASNLFGRGLGEKKLSIIIDKYPYICNNQKKALELTTADLIKINGMGNITATSFIKNLKEFYKFYNLLNIINDDDDDDDDEEDEEEDEEVVVKKERKEKKEKKEKKDKKEKKEKKENKDNPDINEINKKKYNGNIYVFSGIRNKDLEKIIIANGGKVASAVSNKTTSLIVKSFDEETLKVKTAKSLEVPIILYNEFIK